jgi:uncharacterized protein
MDEGRLVFIPYLCSLLMFSVLPSYATEPDVTPWQNSVFNSEKGALAIQQVQAAQGNAEAQAVMGERYARGDGVAQDTKEAFMWYQKSADQGFPAGLGFLSDTYLHDKNYEESYFWFLLELQFVCPSTFCFQLGEPFASHLTPEQVAKVKKRAEEWKPIPSSSTADAKE